MTIRTFQGISPKIAASAYVDETAVIIGDVTIGEEASIWPMVVARGDVQSITIGQRTSIQDGTILHVAHDSEHVPGGYPCVVGANVTVGHRAVLHACRVGDNCIIGMSATIMDGAVVESGTMIGAGSLVPVGKKLESGYLYVGAPVKQVRKLTADEIRYLDYSASLYVNLKNNHQA